MKQRLCGFSVLATVVAALALSAAATAAENQVPFLPGAGDRAASEGRLSGPGRQRAGPED
jgi:hypothetical protein